MITIQTSVLVYDQSMNSINDKGKTIMTIFHEVAHMVGFRLIDLIIYLYLVVRKPSDNEMVE